MSQLKMYRVTRKSFINGHLLEEGDIIEYGGKAGDNLQLIDGEGNLLEDGGECGDDDSAKLAALQQQYEEIFGSKPHHKAGIAKLSEEIEAKRKELGIN
ncbi:hypothetical protein JY494_26645 [Serratia marcescens]|uniref:hypothetical protein n=1 Tax=Serratia marcescens TaxID=615 RepID=UPI00074550A1|nr:hypothetical protein [Serratia marcescens]MBN5203094.1 hypothetical protein [Serratia marcescens]MCX2170648.1 hypothetical protein [Serratia marcescens]MCX2176882.1 hypothetical protein [Serratia marcescens]QLJ62134.1 hypothetical protein HP475_20430 [Serratia marcescens]CVA20454.1 Uncharacterised protein [Serratia marcescens]